MTTRPYVIIIGAGGHAREVAGVLRALGVEVKGFTDRDPTRVGASIDGVDVLGDDTILATLPRDGLILANGVGAIPRASPTASPDPGTLVRRRIFERCLAEGHSFPALVHPNAFVPAGMVVAHGAEIMPGAVLQPGAAIDENAVVGAAAVISHDCGVGAHAFVSPGAVLCGAVIIGVGTFIGAGAIVLPGVTVGENAVVAAGAVVRRNVLAGGLADRRS